MSILLYFKALAVCLFAKWFLCSNIEKIDFNLNNKMLCKFCPFSIHLFEGHLGMKEIEGNKALELAKEVSKLPNGYFNIAFFKYNAHTGEASDKLRTINHCRFRSQLPNEAFHRDSENYFLFEGEHGEPKTAYRICIRFISFSSQGNKLRKIKWT